jgi:hypothetical protein
MTAALDSWRDPSWKEAAREYHAQRNPTRLSNAEFRRWRHESGLDTSSAGLLADLRLPAID